MSEKGQEKKKKEKVVYVDDGRTIADMSNVKGGASKYLAVLQSDCYVCGRMQAALDKIIDNTVELWAADSTFRAKLEAQPYICLDHARDLLSAGQGLRSKTAQAFSASVLSVLNRYIETLREDVSWFCKKFDYRYDQEPWYNSKDAVERAFKFLRSDLHNK